MARTIARTSKRKIATVRAAIVSVKVYDRQAGNMVATTVDAALNTHQEYDYARLVDNEDGTYNVNVHSNLWFKLYTQEALDIRAARAAEREAANAERDAATRERLTEADAAAPVVAAATRREQRNAATLARTVDIHDLGKPAPAATPAVTVTRTRVAITTQIEEACTALGVQFTFTGRLYTVDGEQYTLRDMADLVLQGGYALAFGRPETIPVAANPFAAAPRHRVGDQVVRVDGDPTAIAVVSWVADHDDMTVRYPDGTRDGGPKSKFVPAPRTAVRYWVVPTEGERLSDRHDLLGPYNAADLADRMVEVYTEEGIACEVIASTTRPVRTTVAEVATVAVPRAEEVRSITLQPAQQGGVLPYPFHIDAEGMVGRREFWKRTDMDPERLIGFKLGDGALCLDFADFWAAPQRAGGLRAVFEKSTGGHVASLPIRDVSVHYVVCRCEGEVACSWEKRGDVHVSVCARCGSDR
jgi:hypothetical protein